MKNSVSIIFPLLAIFCLAAERAGAAANFVYHEQSNNFVATSICPSGEPAPVCGRYVENADESGAAGYQIYPSDPYTLRFKVEFDSSTTDVRVYYTTDGSRPCGAFGTPSGRSCLVTNTTQVVVANYNCLFPDTTQNCQNVNVIAATIPAQPAGTTVKYIVSAWHSSGGPEIFANSGTCSGCPSYTFSDETPNVFEYNVLPSAPLNMLKAVSAKFHGGSGPFGVDLPLDGTPGIECRTGGASGNFQLVFTFNNNVVSGNATLTEGTGSVSASPTFSGKRMTVNLTGVINAQTIAVIVSDVTDESGQGMPPTTVRMSLLLGDVTANKVVSNNDVSAVKAQVAASVTNSNFRSDVNANGNITSTDKSATKNEVGMSLP